MEKVKMTKNSPKYGFKKGDEFVVKKYNERMCSNHGRTHTKLNLE